MIDNPNIKARLGDGVSGLKSTLVTVQTSSFSSANAVAWPLSKYIGVGSNPTGINPGQFVFGGGNAVAILKAVMASQVYFDYENYPAAFNDVIITFGIRQQIGAHNIDLRGQSQMVCTHAYGPNSGVDIANAAVQTTSLDFNPYFLRVNSGQSLGFYLSSDTTRIMAFSATINLFWLPIFGER